MVRGASALSASKNSCVPTLLKKIDEALKSTKRPSRTLQVPVYQYQMV